MGAAGVAAHQPAQEPSQAVRTRPAAALSEAALLALRDATTTTTSTTAPPLPPTTAPPKPAPRPAPVTSTTATRRPAATAAVARLTPPATPAGLAPYVGLGTWSDVYDWSRSYTNNQPATGPDDVERMAAAGVQT